MNGIVKPRSYGAVFSHVYAKRMRYVVNVCLILAFVLAFLLYCRLTNFWQTLVLAVTVRAPILAIALVLIRLAHLKLITVELSPHKTLAGQIIGSVTSKQWLHALVFFTLLASIWNSTYLFLLPIVANSIITPVEYGAMRILKEDCVYFGFHSAWIAFVYASFFIIFQRNKVSLKYGLAHILPDKTLFSHMPIAAVNAVLLSLAAAILAPISYSMSRSVLMTILNQFLGHFDITSGTVSYSWSTYFRVVYSCSYMLLAWEAVHHCFIVYASIGCLDGTKPISSYSSDPVQTLVLALLLTNVNCKPLARVTAFQELAWLATCDAKEAIALRNAIFAARSTSGPVWATIASECFAVIRDTTNLVNYRSPSDMAAMSAPSQPLYSPPTDFVFGNALSQKSLISNDDGISPIPRNFRYHSSSGHWLIDYIKSLATAPDTSHRAHGTRKPAIAKLVGTIQTKVHIFYSRFLDLWPGLFFRVSPRRDAALRVQVPSVFGNAVLAISHLLAHSISHDKLHVVLDLHIRDVLQVLEVPIRAFGNYTEHLPPLVHINKQLPSPHSHIIAQLHQLCLQQFFMVCVKFNYKLNDLSLNFRTHKKAKEMIELAIAEQNSKRRPIF